MDETNRDKYRQPTVSYEISSREAHKIVDQLSEIPTAETSEGVYGLEIIEEDGSVDLLRTSKTETKGDQVLKTVLSEMPLVQYEDEGVPHEVLLYSRKTSGYYYETGGPEDVSLFVIDRTVDEEGNKHLAATPGLLYRTNEQEPESQLSLAVLEAMSGAEGIERLIKARQEEDEEEISRLESKLESALRQRGFERGVSTREFTEHFWVHERGVTTYEAAEARYEANEKQLLEEEKEWSELPPAKKLGSWVVWRLNKAIDTSRVRSTAQQNYAARKRQRARR